MSTWGKRVQRARRAGQRGIETTRRVVEQSGKSAALAGRKVANRVLGAQLSARLPSKLIDQSIQSVAEGRAAPAFKAAYAARVDAVLPPDRQPVPSMPRPSWPNLSDPEAGS